MIWFVIPAVKSPSAAHANHTLALIVLIQYAPRLFVIFPLNRQINKTTGAIAKTAWAGAAYNLLLYLLASHVLPFINLINKTISMYGNDSKIIKITRKMLLIIQNSF